jgi:ABC-2 type transport system permease protein
LAAAPLDPDEDDDEGLALLTGTLAAILLFMSLQMFGNYVLVGVVEEKSSAVVELLLVRVRADQLLAGKVIGIGAVALLQFVLAVAAGLVALAISGTDVPGDVWAALPMTAVWFLGGYALYSTLFALAGSLVSRQEEAQAAAAPILTALIGSYLLVYMFGYVPESTASRVLSLLPPIAPFLMPMRMTAGAASVVEITIALVLLVAATVVAWKLASRVYEQMLLRRGTRIAWRETLTALRHG